MSGCGASDKTERLEKTTMNLIASSATRRTPPPKKNRYYREKASTPDFEIDLRFDSDPSNLLDAILVVVQTQSSEEADVTEEAALKLHD